ncbi:MAG TPA: transcription antitermination factor NusB [Verrucomicrobiae bacterium]|nr:transcription antitermination factor NusB [Verrucomicrobiae bacterium]
MKGASEKKGQVGSRRLGREYAAQILYLREIDQVTGLEEAIGSFWSMQESKPSDAAKAFAEKLVRGVELNRDSLDEVIRTHSQNWALDRIAVLDRCILRMALYEMHHCNDIPPVVSINEAIEIAKRFSTEESGRFVNGILDRVCHELLRPARQSAGG